MKNQRFGAPILATTLMASTIVVPARKLQTNNAGASGKIMPAGTMRSRRSGHTATWLRTGKELIAGGLVRSGEFVANTELHDPDIGKFLSTGQMTSPRGGRTARLLPDGRVLLVGGASGPYRDVGCAEIYDPMRGMSLYLGCRSCGS